MKKLVFLLSLLSSTFSAQTNTPTSDNSNTSTLPTPDNLTSRFNADYPNNNPTWTADGPNYRADYTNPTIKTDRYVTYDRSGNVIMRGDRIPASQYPNAINDYYTKTYPNENYDVWSREDKTGTSYYVDRDYETLWFDKTGKYKATTKTKNKAKTRKTK